MLLPFATPKVKKIREPREPSPSFWAREERALARLLLPNLSELAQNGVFEALEELEDLDPTLALKVSSKDVIKGISAWAKDYSKLRAAQLIDTSQQKVTKYVKARKEGRVGSEGFEGMLADLFGADRLSGIMITESTYATTFGATLVYLAAGIKELEWVTNNDEQVCSICSPLAGTSIPLRNKAGIMKSLPPAHPRCRCKVIPKQ